MDLRQLEILQAIAEIGSFTACGSSRQNSTSGQFFALAADHTFAK